jgi:flagellar hook-basal body complex protein FliE
MANPIGAVGTPRIPLLPASESGATGKSSAAGAVDFQGLLLDSLGQTNAMELSAQSAVEKSLTGGDITQVEVVSAVKKADIALRLMLQIRNKVLDAYQEIQQLRM